MCSVAEDAFAQDVARAGQLGDAGRFGEALALLDQCRQAGGDDAELHTARGWALENLGAWRLEDARQAYQLAIARDPGQLWAQAGLATVLGQLGDAAACRQRFESLIGLAAGRTDGEPDLLELKGWAEYQVGRLDAAIATFRQALARDADWLAVRFDLGLALLANGEATEGSQHYQAGLDSFARDGDDARLGVVQVALDDLDALLRQGTGPACGASIRDALAQAAGVPATHHG